MKIFYVSTLEQESLCYILKAIGTRTRNPASILRIRTEIYALQVLFKLLFYYIS